MKNMILADLHIHSTFSDGKLTIPQLVDFYGRRGFGAIAITDHLCELASEFDAWEAASGPYLFSEVLTSGLPRIATSDLHRPEQIHSWKTIVHSERTQDAILAAVRRQQVSFTFFQDSRQS
jgi:hypothetical protein